MVQDVEVMMYVPGSGGCILPVVETYARGGGAADLGPPGERLYVEGGDSFRRQNFYKIH